MHLCITCVELQEVSLKDTIHESDLTKIVRSQKKRQKLKENTFNSK